jgi:hypothetical protein
MSNGEGIRREISRIRRVSDMLTSAHSGLRDTYRAKSISLDILILAISLWLAAMAFADKSLTAKLAPFGVQPIIWLGILALVTFFLSIVHLKVNWKEKGELHDKASRIYASLKQESGCLLSRDDEISEEMYRRLLDTYDFVGEFCIPIPERSFLKYKKRHRIKVKISRLLDDKPAASIRLLKLTMWLEDNCSRQERKGTPDGTKDN